MGGWHDPCLPASHSPLPELVLGPGQAGGCWQFRRFIFSFGLVLRKARWAQMREGTRAVTLQRVRRGVSSPWALGWEGFLDDSSQERSSLPRPGAGLTPGRLFLCLLPLGLRNVSAFLSSLVGEATGSARRGDLPLISFAHAIPRCCQRGCQHPTSRVYSRPVTTNAQGDQARQAGRAPTALWLPSVALLCTPVCHRSCSRPGRRDTQVTLVAAETLLSLSALSSSGSDFRAMPFGKLPSGF